MFKNGRGFIDNETLKSGVSCKWFHELSRFILHADSDGIIFGLTANLLCIFDSDFTGGPLQYLARVFRKNSIRAKITPK